MHLLWDSHILIIQSKYSPNLFLGVLPVSSATQTILEQSNYIAPGFRICIDLCCSPKIEARKILRKFCIKKGLRARNRVFSSFFDPQNGLFPRLVNFWPLGCVATHFTTTRARKAIVQAFQNHFHFWPSPNRLAVRGQRIRCILTKLWEEVLTFSSRTLKNVAYVCM